MVLSECLFFCLLVFCVFFLIKSKTRWLFLQPEMLLYLALSAYLIYFINFICLVHLEAYWRHIPLPLLTIYALHNLRFWSTYTLLYHLRSAWRTWAFLLFLLFLDDFKGTKLHHDSWDAQIQIFYLLFHVYHCCSRFVIK